MSIRKLRRDLVALEKGHRVKVKQLLAQPVSVGELRRSLSTDVKLSSKQLNVAKEPEPVTVGELRRSLSSGVKTSSKQVNVSKEPEVAKASDVSKQSDYEYINLKVETLEVEEKETGIEELEKGEDVPPPIPPRPSVMLRPTVDDSSRKSAMRMLDVQNHVATPKKLLLMFAERFNNRRRSSSPMKCPRVPHRPVKRTQPSYYSRTSCSGCGSMMISGSGLVCTSTSCQLSSANCTRTMLHPSGGEVTDEIKRGACVDEKCSDQKAMPAPSSDELENSEFICLAELSSINHVTMTTRQECSVCLGQPLKYPQSSTPTVPVQPSGTPEDNVLLSGTLITPREDQPLRTPEKAIKRTLSETFTVKPSTTKSDSPVECARASNNDIDDNNNDASKPLSVPEIGLIGTPRKLHEQRQISDTLRLPCLGGEFRSRKRRHTEKNIVAMDTGSCGNRDKTVDSDATAFMQDALCHKPVTYKMKVSRRSKVKGQLKGLGRQIRELGAGKLNLHTLAYL